MKVLTLLLPLFFSCYYSAYSRQLHIEKANINRHLVELVAAIQMPPQFTAKVIYTHHHVKEEELYLEGDILVKDNKYRLTLGDQIVVSNGATIWNYIPSLHELQIGDDIAPDATVNMEAFSPIQLLRLYKHGFTPRESYTSTIGQAQCYIIHFMPTKQQPNVKRLSLCIHANTYQINSIQLIANDQAVHQFDIIHLTTMENVKDQDFEFVIPLDCEEIIDLR